MLVSQKGMNDRHSFHSIECRCNVCLSVNEETLNTSHNHLANALSTNGVCLYTYTCFVLDFWPKTFEIMK